MSEHFDPDTFLADLEARVESANRRLLKEHTALKPLLSVPDVARTLQVSERTVEKLIALGKLRPLWIGGQRRFHPDTIAAYMRSAENQKQRKKRRGA